MHTKFEPPDPQKAPFEQAHIRLDGSLAVEELQAQLQAFISTIPSLTAPMAPPVDPILELQKIETQNGKKKFGIGHSSSSSLLSPSSVSEK